MQSISLSVFAILVLSTFGQEDVSPCPVNENPCQNGANCIGDGETGDFKCDCPDGWTGQVCDVQTAKQSDCASNLCQNGAACIDQLNDYTCLCPVGYEGNNCEIKFITYPVDENPCQNEADHIGDGISGEYTCRCLFGWAGKNCDVNTYQNCGYNLFEITGSLTSPNYPLDYGFNQNCHYYVRVHGAKQLIFFVEAFDTEFGKDALQYAPGVLWNFTGNYNILDGNLTTVPKQFTIDGSDAWFVFESDRTVVRPGFLITYTIEPSNCTSNLCQNGAACIDQLNDYTCVCPVGYEGKNCEINIDDCVDVMCTDGTVCVDGINTYSCRCPLGYTGKNCASPCIDTCNKRVLKPKCGSDGRTYRNRCYLLYAQCMEDQSIKMVHRGACAGRGPIAIVGGRRRTCIQNSGVESSIEIVKCPPTTQAPLPSTMPPNPNVVTTEVTLPATTPCVDNCPLVFEPVCGNDGVNYPNLCKLEVVRCLSDPTLVAVSTGECVVMTTPCRGDCSAVGR